MRNEFVDLVKKVNKQIALKESKANTDFFAIDFANDSVEPVNGNTSLSAYVGKKYAQILERLDNESMQKFSQALSSISNNEVRVINQGETPKDYATYLSSIDALFVVASLGQNNEEKIVLQTLEYTDPDLSANNMGKKPNTMPIAQALTPRSTVLFKQIMEYASLTKSVIGKLGDVQQSTEIDNDPSDEAILKRNPNFFN
jgi:hypothetical protein